MRPPEPVATTKGTGRAPSRGNGSHGHRGAGSVALVGAGPGDPDLLTVKAVRALVSADVILCDALVSRPILDLARRHAATVLVGKRGHRASCRQEDINGLMVRLTREGKRVVRLKAGDPTIFGRAGEEIAACLAARVRVEVIPGISAPQGAAAALAVSLTHRDHARRLQYVTAHGRDGALPDDLDLAALAAPDATTVVYMPRATWRDLAGKLIAAGLPAATPAVAIASATRDDQEVAPATVATLGDRLASLPADGPCLVIYGRAMGELAAPGRRKAAGVTAAAG